MTNMTDVIQHIHTFGNWLVEHQMKLVRVEEAVTHLEDVVAQHEARLVLIEKNSG